MNGVAEKDCKNSYVRAIIVLPMMKKILVATGIALTLIAILAIGITAYNKQNRPLSPLSAPEAPSKSASQQSPLEK